MVDAGLFSNKEPSFKARQLFFQQKLDTVNNNEPCICALFILK